MNSNLIIKNVNENEAKKVILNERKELQELQNRLGTYIDTVNKFF